MTAKEAAPNIAAASLISPVTMRILSSRWFRQTLRPVSYTHLDVYKRQDWIIADYLARRVGEKTDKGLVTPVFPYGHALYHADFAGTMAVSQTTLAQYVKEVCDCLISYGFTHFLFLNGHGGNNNALYNVGQYLRLKNIPVANIQCCLLYTSRCV